jgi:hypothetical protein
MIVLAFILCCFCVVVTVVPGVVAWPVATNNALALVTPLLIASCMGMGTIPVVHKIEARLRVDCEQQNGTTAPRQNGTDTKNTHRCSILKVGAWHCINALDS